MKTTKEEIVKHQRVTYNCDICGGTISYLSQCSVCGKDLCHKHCKAFYQDGSDYASHVACPDHIAVIQEAYDEREELLNAIPDIDEILKTKLGR